MFGVCCRALKFREDISFRIGNNILFVINPIPIRGGGSRPNTLD